MAKKRQKFSLYDQIDFPQYSYKEFPRVMYGPGGQTVTVENVSEQRSLGAGWFTDPAQAKTASLKGVGLPLTAEPDPEPESPKTVAPPTPPSRPKLP